MNKRTRKEALRTEFMKMLTLAREALVLKYGARDAKLIQTSFATDPAEIIALAARDLLRPE